MEIRSMIDLVLVKSDILKCVKCEENGKGTRREHLKSFYRGENMDKNEGEVNGVE